MALAAALQPGYQYRIKAGMFEDEIVTIIDNIAFPDGHENQRKIAVRLPDDSTHYILPRLIDPNPIVQGAPPVRTIPRRSIEADEVDEAADLGAQVALVSPLASEARIVNDGLAYVDEVNPITDPMDYRLDHLRPSPSKIRRYIQRHMDPEDDESITDVPFLLSFTDDGYRAENEGRPANIMLKGDTQSGKTFLVEVLAVEWAKKLGLPKPMPIFTLSGSSGITDFDLFGQTTSYADEHGQRLVWLSGQADLAARVGGILYCDEVNAMGERVTSSLHPLGDHRHQFVNRNKAVLQDGQFMPETVVGSMDLWIIGTYNEGYRGVGEMNEAFINRFRHLPWGYDKAVEAKLIHSPTIRLLGDALRTARAAKRLRTPVGTFALQRLERDVHTFGPKLALWAFTGMFRMQERDDVATIIEDRSIEVLLAEEIRQAEANAETDAPNYLRPDTDREDGGVF